MSRAVRVSLFVLFVHLVSLVPINLSAFSLIQAISGFLMLSFIPGFLLIEYIKDDLRLRDLLYAIGFSVSFSMLIGSAMNLFYLHLQYWLIPFEQPTTSLLYVGVIGVLCGAVWSSGNRAAHRPLSEWISRYDIRVLLLISLLPVFAITGAILINRFSFNGLTLLTIFLIALTPIPVYYFDTNGKYYVISIAAISVALMLQNTVIMTYLGRGDGIAEYAFARQVLQNGFWIPGAAKDAMPRIGVLHPVYTLVMGTSLLWEFKLVHPLLFVAVPVITYVIAEQYFTRDIAFLSAVLYIFLPRTYQIIGRNTRTGSAILFTAFLLLLLLDDDSPRPFGALLAIIFFVSVITSHYGIGPLVLFAIGVAYVLNTFASQILAGKQPSRLRFEQVVLFSVLLIVWYAFLTNGTFGFVVNSIYNQISGGLFFTSESTATRSISYGMPSGSYEVMYYGHLLLGVLSSLGIGFVYLRYLGHGVPYGSQMRDWLDRVLFPGLDTDVLENSRYVHLAMGMYLFFPLSFGPQILSAGRTFSLVMVLVAPYPILLLRSVRFRSIGAKPALAALFVFLLLTSGFVSAAVTHDVSPQPIIDGDRIVESGTTNEQFSYYRSANPRNSIAASNFMLAYAPDGATVYRTTLSKFISAFYTGDEQSAIQFTSLNSSNTNPEGYVYLSEPDTVTETNTRSHAGFVFYVYDPLPSYTNSSTIYTTGEDRVHHNPPS